jgi:hypothetical protein
LKIVLLILSILCCSSANAQVFQGTWKGIYITSDGAFWDSIKLDCKWNPDKTYSIKSYTKGKNISGKDTIVVCNVEYKIISPDSLVLTETEILQPTGISPGICFQTMELKYSSQHHFLKNLIGKWYCKPEKSKGSGFIRLQKYPNTSPFLIDWNPSSLQEQH